MQNHVHHPAYLGAAIQMPSSRSETMNTMNWKSFALYDDDDFPRSFES